MKNNQTSSRISNFNSLRNVQPAAYAEAGSNSPFTSELSTQMDAEHAQYLLDKAAFDQWAMTTTVRDAEVPYMPGMTFGKLITEEEHNSGNLMIVLNKGGKGGVIGATNSWAALSALTDGFATRRYGRQFVFNCHTRMYDPSMPVERDVKTVFENGRYERYSWIARAWKRSTPFAGTELSRWLPKHRELDLILMALSRDCEYHIVLFQEGQVARYNRNIKGRMDLTVAQAILDKSDDWATAQAAQNVNSQGKKLDAAEVKTVVVDGLDLHTIGTDIVVLIKTPLCREPYEKVIRKGNELDIASVAFVLGKGEAKGYTVTLKQ